MRGRGIGVKMTVEQTGGLCQMKKLESSRLQEKTILVVCRGNAGASNSAMGITKPANLSARSAADSPRREASALALAQARTAEPAPPFGESAYGSAYLEWKHWNPQSFGALSVRESADFAALLRKARVHIPAGSPVLEVGFGNGTFLEFGLRRGWAMHGTEVNPGLLECARQKGFEATETETPEPFPSQSFDMVAAFDVMEHIPLEELPGFLRQVRRVLRPGGVFVARFPNGDSPFGRHIQNGDVTHRTEIGSIRARYLATQAVMNVVFLGCEVQAIWAGRAHTPHRLFAVPVKKLMNAFLNLVFSPRDPLPFCSANLELVLRKPDAMNPGSR
jgi:SAM-dependent methyltransferase